MGVCKAALDSIVKYLAYDLGPRGIRVNALSAGPLQTISGRGAGVDEMLGLYEAMAPLGRNITHEEAGKTRRVSALGHVRRASPARSCTSTPATTRWARRGGCWTGSRRRKAADQPVRTNVRFNWRPFRTRGAIELRPFSLAPFSFRPPFFF